MNTHTHTHTLCKSMGLGILIFSVVYPTSTELSLEHCGDLDISKWGKYPII